jgi:hypothetical protein
MHIRGVSYREGWLDITGGRSLTRLWLRLRRCLVPWPKIMHAPYV